MTSKKPAKRAKPREPVRIPNLAYPEQFRMDCLTKALQLPNQDAKQALASARAFAQFVLGDQHDVVTKE